MIRFLRWLTASYCFACARRRGRLHSPDHLTAEQQAFFDQLESTRRPDGDW